MPPITDTIHSNEPIIKLNTTNNIQLFHRICSIHLINPKLKNTNNVNITAMLIDKIMNRLYIILKINQRVFDAKVWNFKKLSPIVTDIVSIHLENADISPLILVNESSIASCSPDMSRVLAPLLKVSKMS